MSSNNADAGPPVRFAVSTLSRRGSLLIDAAGLRRLFATSESFLRKAKVHSKIDDVTEQREYSSSRLSPHTRLGGRSRAGEVDAVGRWNKGRRAYVAAARSLAIPRCTFAHHPDEVYMREISHPS